MITFPRDMFDSVATDRKTARVLQGLVLFLLWISCGSVHVHLTAKEWYFSHVRQLFNRLTLFWNLERKGNVKTFSIYYHKTLFFFFGL